jgi:dihydroxy-acid dehydratase
MPEAGYLPIPKKLARMGVRDMVRISDARMSGTAFGTVVLHVTPDASSGEPLALVRTGDRIRLSLREHRLDLLVEEGELARRRSAFALETSSAGFHARGYSWLYDTFITQANEGCDFAFLRKDSGIQFSWSAVRPGTSAQDHASRFSQDSWTRFSLRRCTFDGRRNSIEKFRLPFRA